jgi:hypothetical protein
MSAACPDVSRSASADLGKPGALRRTPRIGARIAHYCAAPCVSTLFFGHARYLVATV